MMFGQTKVAEEAKGSIIKDVIQHDDANPRVCVNLEDKSVLVIEVHNGKPIATYYPYRPMTVYEYEIDHRLEDGSIQTTTLSAVDDDHAREEAWYECEGTVVAVRKGEIDHIS
jgi:hypothetical protein